MSGKLATRCWNSTGFVGKPQERERERKGEERERKMEREWRERDLMLCCC